MNPEDGTITPYFALSIVDKYIYPDVKALLLAQRKDLYENYMKLLDKENEDDKLLKGQIKPASIDISRFIPDTHMYRPSRIMKSLQYLTEVNVIRIWNDQIIEFQHQRKARVKDLSNNDALLIPAKENKSN